jgi:hypothetical protein
MQPNQKITAPADQLIAFARAMSGGGPRNQIPAEQFEEAAKKVGQKSKARLSWAIKFAQESVEQMTFGDWYNAQLESGAFLNPHLAFAEKKSKSIPFSPVFFLSRDQVKKAKEEFLHLIKAATGVGFSFHVSQLSVNVDANGISYVTNEANLSDSGKHSKAQLEQAMLRLAQLLSTHWGYVGLCDRKRHGCGRYFLKSRTDQQFCTKTCLNRSTTYRQRGKEPSA